MRHMSNGCVLRKLIRYIFKLVDDFVNSIIGGGFRFNSLLTKYKVKKRFIELNANEG